MSNANEFERTFSSAFANLSAGKACSADEMLAMQTALPGHLQCFTGKGDPDLPEDKSELKTRAEKAERMISEIERGVASLRQKITSVTANLPQHVLSPLNRIKRNENNPLRNKYKFRTAVLEGQISQYPIPRNAYFYMLAGEERQKGAAASFRPSDRTLFGNEEFSGDSPIDAITACHESVHVLQNDEELSKISTMEQARAHWAKMRFLAEKKRVVLNAELPAFRTEMQIANLALEGDLEQPGSLTESSVMQRLGASRPDQEITARTLVNLAKAFPGFESHEPINAFPHSFVAKIILMYRSAGYEICAEDPASGNIIILSLPK